MESYQAARQGQSIQGHLRGQWARAGAARSPV